MNLKELHAPFPATEIEWRVGSTTKDKTRGLALAYLTARHVMERLDEVCGPENWQDRYEFHGSRTVCYLSIKIGDQWVTKADGAGDSDVEAEKGAISDALKRAAVKWGIGRYLYSLASPWVELEAHGNSVKIKASEYAKLERLMAGATMPDVPTEMVRFEGTNIASELSAIDNASTLDNLQREFAAAWKVHKGPNSRASLQSHYEARKAVLTPDPKNLGQHLDNLKAQEDARNAIPN
jgi:hypothetical protein